MFHNFISISQNDIYFVRWDPPPPYLVITNPINNAIENDEVILVSYYDI